MKIDMHVHTKYSHDGVSEVREIFQQAKKKGLDGVALTDHSDNRCWEEAREVSEDMDMLFIPGEEIKIINDEKRSNGEILLYFLEEGTGSRTIEDIEEIRDTQNALGFIAHPFDKSRPHPKDVEFILDYVDGLETLNARTRMKRFNSKAFKLAEKLGLPTVAGSDAHIPEEVGVAYTEVKDAENLEEFKKGLKEGRGIARGKRTKYFLHWASQIKGRI